MQISYAVKQHCICTTLHLYQCRHPVSSKRPTFDDIVTILAMSDMGVADSVGDSNDALVLGGPLNAGKSLYPELQELYVKTTQ